MTLFWILIAGLIAVVLLLLAPALVRARSIEHLDRDAQNVGIARESFADLEASYAAGAIEEPDYLASKEELEQALASDLAAIPETQVTQTNSGLSKIVGLLVLALVPIGALLLYFQLGMPAGLEISGGPSGNTRPTPMAQAGTSRDRQATTQARQESAQGAVKGPDGKPLPPVEEMLASLATRLAEDPDNPDGWILLGRSYATVQRYADAADSYQQALDILGEDADVLAALAEVLAMANQRQFSGRPQALLARALKKNSAHPSGLWLSGIAATQVGDDRKAIDYWQHLRSQIPKTEDAWTQITKLIDEAKIRSGMETAAETTAETTQVSVNTTAAAPNTPSTEAAAAQQIKVQVSLPEGSNANPEDTVFIFAKAMQGPPMPLAAVRKQVKDLPLTLTLDDSMAMMPQMRLSNFKSVKVSARISKSGNPIAQAGDIYGEQSPVALGDSVQIVIDQIKP